MPADGGIASVSRPSLAFCAACDLRREPSPVNVISGRGPTRMIIDAHIHVGEWSHADFLGRAVSMKDVVEVLDDAGIAGAGIMTTDRCDNAGLLAEARAVLAAGWRGALWMFAWVRPDTGDLDWADANAGHLTGLKIHPSLSRARLTDAAFGPALELAEAENLAILVHCGRWQEIASYRFAVEAAKARPRVRFILAHAGGDTPPLATAAAELVAREKLDNVWFEFSGVREYWVIERNVALLGAERYLMGSDYGLAHPLMYLGAVAGMALPERDKRRILGDNARELFGAPLEP